MLFQQMLENTYPCSLTTRLNIKTQSKEIYKNLTSLIFKSNFSMNCLIFELIYYEALIFSVKFIFFKNIIFMFYCL